MDDALAGELLAGIPRLWQWGSPADVLAADLALLGTPLAAAEVRATSRDEEDGWELCIAARDRRGLLAAAAAVLADAGATITAASVASWPSLGLALQRVTARAASRQVDHRDWASALARLRVVLADPGSVPPPPWSPLAGPVSVRAFGEPDGTTMVVLDAPDQPGLLARVAGWFAAAGCDVDAAKVTSVAGRAHDRFVVRGPVDTAGLLGHVLTATAQPALA
jgi:UTP:GlnB (protein PII) uridylyltransferase